MAWNCRIVHVQIKHEHVLTACFSRLIISSFCFQMTEKKIMLVILDCTIIFTLVLSYRNIAVAIYVRFKLF